MLSGMDAIRALVEASVEWATALRHEFHQHPELGYEEKWTSGRIQQVLTDLGVTHRGGWAGGTGVVARIPATLGLPTRTVALRSDIDALPIEEETGKPYASLTPGRMHACGHDGHITMLLMAARVLSQIEKRDRDVVLLFQPAEEGGAGAKRLVEEGALEGVDVVYGLHGWPTVPLGQVSTRVGPMMASATQFEIVVRGAGGHAAYPNLGIDPIVVAAQLILALQTLTSRVVDPFEPVVVTVGEVRAGHAHNVIPDEATLHGTMRTLSDVVQADLMKRIDQMAQHVCAAHGASVRVRWATDPYPVTWNHPEAVETLRRVATQCIGDAQVIEETYPSMAGEDFSFYGKQVPACFFFLGLNPDPQGSYPKLHTPCFDFNDNALPIGAQIMAGLGVSG